MEWELILYLLQKLKDSFFYFSRFLTSTQWLVPKIDRSMYNQHVKTQCVWIMPKSLTPLYRDKNDSGKLNLNLQWATSVKRRTLILHIWPNYIVSPPMPSVTRQWTRVHVDIGKELFIYIYIWYRPFTNEIQAVSYTSRVKTARALWLSCNSIVIHICIRISMWVDACAWREEGYDK